MLVAAFVIVAGAASGPSFLVLFGRDAFPGWLAGPLAALDLPSLSQPSFAVLVLVMCAGYAVTLALRRALPARVLLGGVGILHLVFLLGPLLLTTDVFGYIDYARLGVLHDLNPYVQGSGDAPAGDPLRPFVIWHDDPSPYGPLFTVLTYPLALLDFRAASWVAKLAAALASLGSVALVWRCARRMGRDPVFPALLLGLNPVVLIWAVGGAHNDLLLMLLVLVAVERFLALGHATAGGALAAATAVKASAGLVLPFALLGAGRPGRTLAGAAAGAVAAGLVALVVLGPGVLVEFPGAFALQQGLVSEHSVPTYLGQLAGAGGASDAVRAACAVALLAAVAGLLVRTWRGADWLTSAAWATLALLLTTAWLMPWYLVWLLPLAALGRSRALQGAALGLTGFIVVTRLFG